MPSKNQTIEATVTEKNCGNCGARSVGGECRRVSPARNEDDGFGHFPHIIDTDWCLDWVAKTPKLEITINAKPALNQAHRIIKLTAENADLREAVASERGKSIAYGTLLDRAIDDKKKVDLELQLAREKLKRVFTFAEATFAYDGQLLRDAILGVKDAQ